MKRPVIVLFGGTSSERRVSVASAQTVVRALLPHRAVHPWFWGTDDAIYEVASEILLAHGRPFERDLVPAGIVVAKSISAALDGRGARESVFFLALHGIGAEDGLLQGWLESRGLPFTGSGAKASRNAFDKARGRDLVQTFGARVAAAEFLDHLAVAAQLERLLAEHGQLVLKPVAEGSSEGLLFLDRRDALPEILKTVSLRRSQPYLVEAFVTGAELTVGVIDDGVEPYALPCSEVRLDPGCRFDFAGKYLGRGTAEVTPAEVPRPVAEDAQALALAAHRAIGCYGYSRTDLIATDNGPVFLETNTLPGLSAASFIPQQLEAAGIPIEAFVLQQIELAERRYECAEGPPPASV
jgi:D-alanine-D-alanine ligase